MKICFLSVNHPHDDTRVLHKEARALADAGHEVWHIAGGEPTRTFVEGGVHVELFPRGPKPTRMLRVAEIARRHRPDVVHCNEVESWVIGLAMKARRPSLRVVFDVHEHYPSRFAEPHMPRALRRIGPPVMRLMYRTLTRVTDHIVLAKRSLAPDFPAALDHVDYIFNYGPLRIDVPTRAEVPPEIARQFDGAPFTAVHVGGFSRARGWPELLTALGRVRNDMRVLCLGPVTEGREVLVDEARRLGVEDRLRIIDRVPYEQMFAYLAMSDAGLMLYQPGILNHTYAFPMKLYDYMLAELPVIGPDFAVEVSPVVDGCDCGISIDTSDPQALADALDRLADDRAAAAAMGKRGRAAVETTYNWEAEAAKLVELYTRLQTH